MLGSPRRRLRLPTPPHISRRGHTFEGSPIVAFETQRMRLERAGKDIVNFAGGESDLPTPSAITETAVRALREGQTRYTEDAGLLELREAISAKLSRENSLRYGPDDVLVTPGSKFAIFLALQVICDTGDTVIIPTPFWPTYAEQVRLAGARSQFAPTQKSNAFKLTPDDLRMIVSKGTKALILNNPVNPTGAVYSRAELLALAEVVLKKRLFVIVDEIYEHLLFEGPGHVSFASLGKEIAAHVITVGGFSKNYSMTGWRLGFATGPRFVISAMKRMQSQVTSCANTAAQHAGVVALAGGPLLSLRDTLRTRRNALTGGLAAIPGLSPLQPMAGFYVFTEVTASRRGRRNSTASMSNSLANGLLEDASVAVLPGSCFGVEGYLRLTFAPTPLPRIAEGLARLKKYFARA